MNKNTKAEIDRAIEANTDVVMRTAYRGLRGHGRGLVLMEFYWDGQMLAKASYKGLADIKANLNQSSEYELNLFELLNEYDPMQSLVVTYSYKGLPIGIYTLVLETPWPDDLEIGR